MLAQLYHEMHTMAYLHDKALSAGVTLLHVWTWEHITITRLDCRYYQR